MARLDRQQAESWPQVKLFGPPHYREPLLERATGGSLCGLVALVALRAPHLTPEALSGTIDRVREWEREFPRTTFVCVLPDWPELAPERTVLAMTVLPGAFAFPGGPPGLEALRPLISNALLIQPRLREWVERRGREHRGTGRAWGLVEAGLGGLPSDTMPAELSVPPRIGPPSQSRWHQLGKPLRAAMALQRHPERTVSRVAITLGYHDGSSLSRQLNGVFGRRPAFVRSRLGWRWLVEDWWGLVGKPTREEGREFGHDPMGRGA
jgi:hypothetical protein